MGGADILLPGVLHSKEWSVFQLPRLIMASVPWQVYTKRCGRLYPNGTVSRE